MLFKNELCLKVSLVSLKKCPTLSLSTNSPLLSSHVFPTPHDSSPSPLLTPHKRPDVCLEVVEMVVDLGLFNH